MRSSTLLSSVSDGRTPVRGPLHAPERPLAGEQSEPRHFPSSAGNLATLRALGIRAKLDVSAPSDPEEQEADRIADAFAGGAAVSPRVARGSGGSDVHRACATCEQDETVHRKPLSGSGASPAPGALPGLGGSGGQRLPTALRRDYERFFDTDLSSVRIHAGAPAADASRAIQAKAFTAGHDIAFGTGEYAPGTGEGRKLLAHELAHVIQQDGSDTAPRIQRQLQCRSSQQPLVCRRGDGWFPGMRAKLVKNVYELHHVRFWDGETVELTSTPYLGPGGYHHYVYVQLLDRNSPRSGPHPVDVYDIEPVDAAQAAFAMFSGGASDFGFQPGLTMPRPLGLPLDEGYTLQLIPQDLPPELVAGIPEGQIVTLTPDMLATGVSEPERLSSAIEGLGGGAYSGLRGANTALMNFGFTRGVNFSVGIVAIPPANINPFSPHFNPIDLAAPLERAGHSAVYVRQGGRITTVRGYNPLMKWSMPSSIWNVVRNYGDIFSGKMGVPGEITPDAPLFKSTAARTIEYPVTPEVAARLAQELPPLGAPGPGQPPQYTAPPSEYARITGTQPGCVGTNCGLWATQQAETALRGRIGIAGEPPIVDVPATGQASQGRLYDMLGRVEKGTPATEVPGATGPAVGGRMSTGVKVLKWGGRTFMVVSVATLGYDVATAPPEERLHVAFVGGSSLVGGIAAGAALGLACGPGAPVCVIITGTIGGILGGLGAGELAETLWRGGQAMKSAGEVFNPMIERAIWGDQPIPEMGYYPPRQYGDNPFEYEEEKARYMRGQGGR